MFWKLVARVASLPRVADWLIRRAQRTPYSNIEHHGSLYMERFWLFNPQTDSQKIKYRWLPSIRVNHICRPDIGRDLHDHPFNSRTIILKGDYWEQRLVEQELGGLLERYSMHHRKTGDTATVSDKTFHRVTKVSDGGVWTIFISDERHQDWGFLVNGVKVQRRAYAGYKK